MADKIINVRVDVTKLKKEWFFKGEKGTYADIAIFYNEEQDQYGNNGMVVQSVPKAEREKDNTLRGPILGNCRVYVKSDSSAFAEGMPGGTVGGAAAAASNTPAPAPAPSFNPDEDLPF